MSKTSSNGSTRKEGEGKKAIFWILDAGSTSGVSASDYPQGKCWCDEQAEQDKDIEPENTQRCLRQTTCLKTDRKWLLIFCFFCNLLHLGDVETGGFLCFLRLGFPSSFLSIFWLRGVVFLSWQVLMDPSVSPQPFPLTFIGLPVYLKIICSRSITPEVSLITAG